MIPKVPQLRTPDAVMSSHVAVVFELARRESLDSDDDGSKR